MNLEIIWKGQWRRVSDLDIVPEMRKYKGYCRLTGRVTSAPFSRRGKNRFGKEIVIWSVYVKYRESFPEKNIPPKSVLVISSGALGENYVRFLEKRDWVDVYGQIRLDANATAYYKHDVYSVFAFKISAQSSAYPNVFILREENERLKKIIALYDQQMGIKDPLALPDNNLKK